MEQDIQLIKWMLVGLYVLLFLIGLFVFNNVKNLKTRAATHLKEEFLNEAMMLQDNGDYDALNSLARERAREYPKDPTAYFYMGFAQFKLEYYSPALTSFSKLNELDPVWEKELVAAYVEEIKVGMKKPYLKKSTKKSNEQEI